MSLLEDVFLEDEAGEAHELERIIEGDGFDERPRSEASNSDNDSAKEDEAEEDKRTVDPTKAKPKRVIKNPRFILNPARLTGPRGIQVLPEHFKDFRFKGKGHEKEDLDLVLKKLEHWAYRLYPKFQFDDCLKKIETLGKKRPVMVHLQKIRSDQYISEETVVQKDSSDDETPQPDEFDILLQQQIELARSTPVPESVKKTPAERSFTMPKATSSPSINEEQRERMLRNRKLAEERRLAKLKQNTDEKIINNDNSDSLISKKHNKSNVIDSSDEEDSTAMNQSVSVDIHDNVNLKSNDNGITKSPNDSLISKKHNKTNVIESSDEEDSNATNQSITVDIHDNDKQFDNLKTVTDNEKTQTNQNIDSLDTDGRIDSNPTDNIDRDKQSDIQDSHKNGEDNDIGDINDIQSETVNIDVSKSDSHSDKNSDTKDSNDRRDITENDSDKEMSDENNVLTKELGSNDNKSNENTELNNVEDIMDFDFSDDF